MTAVLQQTLMFIVQFVFGLYSFVIVMRLWLRLIGIDHGHPMVLSIAKATNPIVNKLQKYIPSFGQLEIASVVLLVVVTLVKLLLVSFISGHIPQPGGLVVWTLISAIEVGLDAIFYMMIMMALLSWIPSAQPAMYSLLTQITSPLLAPIRRMVPLLGGMDLSPVIILVVVQVLEMLLVHPVVRASLMASFH
jgi:YggT family protein